MIILKECVNIGFGDNIMRRMFLVLISFLMIFNFCSCGKVKYQNTPEEHEKVIINLPKDDSVNGFRTEEESGNNSLDYIEGGSIGIGSPSPPKPETSIQYCANIKSKTFHLSGCSSVKNMKDENKLFISDRNALISDGYKPCSRCKP